MSKNPRKTKIFIFDDHSSVRESYRRWLEVEGFEITGMEGGYSRKSVQTVRNLKPDIILMDIDMQGGKEGFNASKKILKNIPNAKIIFVTHYNEFAMVKEAFQHGAHGYFSKSDDLQFLKEAIGMVCKGHVYLSPTATDVIVNSLKQNKHSSGLQANAKELFNLTRQETTILNYIAQGLANKEIATKLSTNEKRIKNIVFSVLAKLGAKNRAHAVFIGLLNGLVDANRQ